MRTTFAVREFTGEPLPDRTLDRILDNAGFAPSGGNRQAAHIIVVRDQQTRDRLAELSVPGAQRYVAQLGIGEAPWNPLTPSGVPAADVDTTEVPDTLIAPLRRASVVLGVCLDLRYGAAPDPDLDRGGGGIRRQPRHDGDAARAAGAKTVGNPRFLCGRCGVGSRQADATNPQATPQDRCRNRHAGA